MKQSVLLTGGAGFIGSQFCRQALNRGYSLVVLDALTYAGHLENIDDLRAHPNFTFVKGDIGDFDLVLRLLRESEITHLVHMAAESHVDNSIRGPRRFLETNVVGTFTLLEAARSYLSSRPPGGSDFRFLHVSTDEVFGSLESEGYFTETTAYSPRSPYSATKAASDHLVRAWAHTFQVPTIVTNCSNNYGPRQFPEKLIPLMIRHALQGKPLPVYGNGENIRDWIHVEDHCEGVLLALEKGQIGSTYCLGGRSERRNIDVVQGICQNLDELKPRADGRSYREQITFVTDRPGHDLRYAIDSRKAEDELGFRRKFSSFEQGLHATIRWYLDNEKWIAAVESRGAKL